MADAKDKGLFYRVIYIHWTTILALLVFTQQNYSHGASVRRRPSSVVCLQLYVKLIFSEIVKQINAKFCGKVATRHISRAFFSFQKFEFFNCNDFFFVFFNLGPYGSENFKTLLLPQL